MKKKKKKTSKRSVEVSHIKLPRPECLKWQTGLLVVVSLKNRALI